MSATIARTIILVITVLNAFLTMEGKNPLNISDDAVYEIVSNVLAIGSIIWGWWKNNSFTSEAKQADEYLKKLRGK